MTEKTRGLVLSYIKYKETSIICKIFTESFGIQSYIINGIRNSKSKNIGSIKVLKKNNFKKEKYKKFFQLKKKQQKQPIYSLNI